MKYFLSTSGKKCCCDCTWKLQLAQNEDGYDLIQIKRGFVKDINSMRLQPGEPAIVFDTGAFYIGGSDGTPMLINKSSIGSDSAVLLVTRTELNTGLVIIPYSDMRTPDGSHPSAGDLSVYSTVLICDENGEPSGIASVQNWTYSSDSAQLYYKGFSDTAVNLIPFTESDLDAIIDRAEAIA